MGRKKFIPTDRQRAIVSAMACVGTPHSVIASSRHIGIDEKTLRKYFKQELEDAKAVTNAEVVTSLYFSAISGKEPAAAMFWCKTRLGWRENDNANLGPPPILAVQINGLADAVEIAKAGKPDGSGKA